MPSRRLCFRNLRENALFRGNSLSRCIRKNLCTTKPRSFARGSEVSRGRSSCHEGVKGRRNRREYSVILWIGMSQMFAQRSSPKGGGRVKPQPALAVRNPSGRIKTRQTQAVAGGTQTHRPQRFQPPGADPQARWCGRGATPLSRFHAMTPSRTGECGSCLYLFSLFLLEFLLNGGGSG